MYPGCFPNSYRVKDSTFVHSNQIKVQSRGPLPLAEWSVPAKGDCFVQLHIINILARCKELAKILPKLCF